LYFFRSILLEQPRTNIKEIIFRFAKVETLKIVIFIYICR